MIGLVAGGIAATALGIYEIRKRISPDLQGVKGTTPSGDPFSIVVPSIKAYMKVFPPAKKNSAHVDPAQPTIVTPGGASNFRVVTKQDVQRALNTLGYASPPLVVDGDIGPKSVTAIKSFQTSKKLPVDGIVGDSLKLQLELALAALATSGSPPLDAKGPTVDTVLEIQTALNKLGASPKLAEDGKLGPKTTAAIAAFQIHHGLGGTGIADPKTKLAISAALAALLNAQVGYDLTLQHGGLSITHKESPAVAGDFGVRGC